MDIDVNEGTLMELQGHIGRFQVLYTTVYLVYV